MQGLRTSLTETIKANAKVKKVIEPIPGKKNHYYNHFHPKCHNASNLKKLWFFIAILNDFLKFLYFICFFNN
jgi:hypothetical protein